MDGLKNGGLDRYSLRLWKAASHSLSTGKPALVF